VDHLISVQTMRSKCRGENISVIRSECQGKDLSRSIRVQRKYLSRSIRAQRKYLSRSIKAQRKDLSHPIYAKKDRSHLIKVKCTNIKALKVYRRIGPTKF
jgi:hypothetical protein